MCKHGNVKCFHSYHVSRTQSATINQIACLEMRFAVQGQSDPVTARSLNGKGMEEPVPKVAGQW